MARERAKFRSWKGDARPTVIGLSAYGRVESQDAGSGPVPRAEDCYRVIEVADSSLGWDRDTKAPRYAAAGIPSCWIVDLSAEEILVLSGPGPSGYRDLHRAQRGEILEVSGLPGVSISVDEVLGPP